MNEYQIPKRFYSLDVLRGVAALSVVFWHWRHFFYTGNVQDASFSAQNLPLFDTFSVFYTDGWLAVDLFFSLSGFIFYWLYSGQIANKIISGKEFFLLRFSRLYPLHLATLLLVAFGQMIYIQINHTAFAYSHNDTYHFILNLVFAMSWWSDEQPSFNGPAWSVSIEVALYALFYFLCKYVPIRKAVLIGIAISGLIVFSTFNHFLGRGLASFFIGGLVYLAYQHILSAGWTGKALRYSLGLALALWVITAVAIKTGWNFSNIPFIWRYTFFYSTLFLFPMTILTLALIETQRGQFGKRFALVGDISYSTYLLHFPLQLLFMIAIPLLGLDQSVFLSHYTLAVFFALLLTISYISHVYFERPMQRYIRRKWADSRIKAC